jgi:hypothetical protein
MKLMYSVPGKIWWINNFLDSKIYKGIHNAIFKERKKINLHSVKDKWDENLITNLIPPLRVGVDNYKPFEILKTLVKHNVYFKIKDVEKITTTIHYMKKGTGINWHHDANWKYGATYYINHKWNSHWGGEFMFTNNTGHGWIPPVGNSLVIVKTPITHKVNTILSPVVPRISVQMFMK